MPEYPITARFCAIRHEMQIYIIFQPIPYHDLTDCRTDTAIEQYMQHSWNRESRADAYRRAPLLRTDHVFQSGWYRRRAFSVPNYASKQFKPNIYYSPNLQEISDHQHYPPLGLDKCVRVAHDDSIDLSRGHRIAVLADMKFPAVYNLCNLLCPESSVSFDKNIKYSFFYFHFNANS